MSARATEGHREEEHAERLDFLEQMQCSETENPVEYYAYPGVFEGARKAKIGQTESIPHFPLVRTRLNDRMKDSRGQESKRIENKAFQGVG